MSTTLINRVHVDALHEDILLDPPVVVVERGTPVDVTIGEALGYAILQNGLDESVISHKQSFDSEVAWLAEVGLASRCVEIIHESFEAQGFHVTEVPSAA